MKGINDHKAQSPVQDEISVDDTQVDNINSPRGNPHATNGKEVQRAKKLNSLSNLRRAPNNPKQRSPTKITQTLRTWVSPISLPSTSSINLCVSPALRHNLYPSSTHHSPSCQIATESSITKLTPLLLTSRELFADPTIKRSSYGSQILQAGAVLIQLSNHKKINGSDLAALMMLSEQAHADVRAAITQALGTATNYLKQINNQLQELANELRELKHSPPRAGKILTYRRRQKQ